MPTQDQHQDQHLDFEILALASLLGKIFNENKDLNSESDNKQSHCDDENDIIISCKIQIYRSAQKSSYLFKKKRKDSAIRIKFKLTNKVFLYFVKLFEKSF